MQISLFMVFAYYCERITKKDGTTYLQNILIIDLSPGSVDKD